MDRHSSVLGCLIAVAIGSVVALPSSIAQKNSEKIPDRELAFFEANIRPLLVKQCYECHSVESGAAEGGLRVDSAAALLRGGETGPAIVPGQPERSLLILAVRHQQPAKAMPPLDSGQKLSDADIDKLVRWIRAGAPDPRKDNSKGLEKKEAKEFYASLETWWAYQPIKKPEVPNVDAAYSNQPIDQFLRSAQIKTGVTPAAHASYETLVRRLYYDIIGLPPTLDQTQRFNNDIRSFGFEKAYEQLVDELLASDQYGMHWGRHWLDVARYAESSGREFNVNYPHAWRYRNWIIDAYNLDMPYDDFLVRQIAGDQMPTRNKSDLTDNLIATGFLAIGSKPLNERNPRQFALDQADEQIDATFQATMGLTMACARCHDHKFDPISQRDYTSVAGIFLSTKTLFGTPNNGMQNRNGTDLKQLPSQEGQATLVKDVSEEEVVAHKDKLAKIENQATQLKRELLVARQKGQEIDQDKVRDLRRAEQEATILRARLSNVDDDGNAVALAMTVEDYPIAPTRTRTAKLARAMQRQGGRTPFASIMNSPLFARGELELAGEEIPRGVPEMFGKSNRYEIPEDASGRLQLARWIVADHNPMTARVAANRIWTWIFDEPIVDSVDNFGLSGSEPAHPELLDYLAIQLRENNWSQKKLIREIVLSRTYRAASEHNADNALKDPDNRTLWRANLKRLPAEAIRDSMLLSAGVLDSKVQVGSEIARMGDGIVRLPGQMDLPKPKFKNGPLAKLAERRGNQEPDVRTVFLAFPRTESYEIFDLFDAPDGTVVQGRRDTTNVPTQSLYLLNSPSVQRYALETAKRTLQDSGSQSSIESKIEHMFRTILSRKPSTEELNGAKTMLDELKGDAAQGLASVAKGLFATAEFRYVD